MIIPYDLLLQKKNKHIFHSETLNFLQSLHNIFEISELCNTEKGNAVYNAVKNCKGFPEQICKGFPEQGKLHRGFLSMLSSHETRKGLPDTDRMPDAFTVIRPVSSSVSDPVDPETSCANDVSRFPVCRSDLAFLFSYSKNFNF